MVYSKPPFGGPLQAIRYLGRYTHRVAISDQRILKARDGSVTFQWKDYRRKEKHNSQEMTVEAGEFIRRFLIHVLPPGFPRIRYYGFLANRNRRQMLVLCRKLLTEPVAELLPEQKRCREIARALDRRPSATCPECRQGEMRRIRIVAAYLWPLRPPDTS
ncbi:MAG: putative transposase y4qJ [Bryobacterales bacterium]|nr:putative transposase y4qJ [Bryobacterales bacterium]